MGQWAKDIQFSLRLLHRNLGFTAIVVVILGVGIGANSTIWGVMNSFLFRPLPFKDPEKLMMVMGSNPRLMGDELSVVSYPDFLDWKSQNRVFEEMAVMTPKDMNFSGGGEPERITGLRVSAPYFSILGVAPILGRTFLADECSPGGNRVVILSQGLWQRQFGSSPSVIGHSLRLDGFYYTVVGVIPTCPERFFDSKLWIPLVVSPQESGRGNHFLLPIARLKQNVSLEQARIEMQTIGRRLEKQYPDSDAGWGIAVETVREGIYGQLQPFFVILLAVVGCILLIACTNVANLLLARNAEREREIAVRTALGASRLRLVRQLLVESLVLALLGGALGLLLSFWGSGLIDAFLSGINLPIALPQIQIDARVLGFTLALSVLTGMLFGLVPAFQTSKSDLSDGLKAANRGSTSGNPRRRLKSALVVSEVALSLVLLISATLLLMGFRRLLKLDPGFRPDKVLTLSLTLSQAQYPDGDRQGHFLGQLLGRLASLPGVQSLGATNSVPMGLQNFHRSYVIEGRPKPGPGQDLSANYHTVSPQYFSTLAIPLKRGRAFTEQDAKGTLPVAIINETLARTQWGTEDPVGKRLSIAEGPWSTIVGVVGDAKYFGLGVGILPEICVPLAQNPSGDMNLVLRSAVDPLSLVPAVRREIQSIDPQQPITKIRTMENLVSNSVWIEQSVFSLVGSFAGAALILALLGIYGVVSYSVSQRKREIGIRMALGARSQEVLTMVLKQGLKLVIMGVGIGVGIAIAVTRILSSLLYGVDPLNPLAFVGLSFLLIGAALLASYLPAHRGAKVDPIVALRYE